VEVSLIRARRCELHPNAEENQDAQHKKRLQIANCKLQIAKPRNSPAHHGNSQFAVFNLQFAIPF